MSLLEMQAYFYEWVIEQKREDTLSIITMGGFSIDSMRNNLVEAALKNEQTHLLFLDTDMTFPKETIRWMIEDLEMNEDQGIDAITGIYVRKSPPYTPHVYPKYNFENKTFHIAGKFPTDKLFEVEGAGTGILMIKAEVFKRIEGNIWFLMKDDHHSGGKKELVYGRENDYIPDTMGEDLYFFLKTRPKTLCDPRLRCMHYTITAFGLNDYLCYNGFKESDGDIIASSEGLKKLADSHENHHPNLKNSIGRKKNSSSTKNI